MSTPPRPSPALAWTTTPDGRHVALVWCGKCLSYHVEGEHPSPPKLKAV